ncbi:MAG: GNAT family N-acetyltransferase [Lachnospiraceae bacterium]|nr:GNAT family N-acetyltransferase [Lachnospiraceae bacterium]
MGIRYTTELFPCDRERVNALYGRDDAYGLFEKSFAHVLAYDGNTIAGAVRAISEGVETVLIVDLKAVDPHADTEANRAEDTAYTVRAGSPAEAEAYTENVITGLLRELEAGLTGRRVMLYGNREQLAVLESAGYGRCKNAWTLWREGFKEADFLPAGYRFESEFYTGHEAGTPAALKTRIIYPGGRSSATDTEINELLTKAFFGRPHDVTKTAKAFAGSQYIGTAYDGGKLVGVARAVADGSRFATILNVAVDPEYQGLSIGKTLLLELAGRIHEETVVLNTHPGAVGFYNKLKEFRRNRYVFEKHIADGTEPKRPDNPEFRSRMFTPAGYRFPDE